MSNIQFCPVCHETKPCIALQHYGVNMEYVPASPSNPSVQHWACDNCAVRLSDCPVCRRPIQSVNSVPTVNSEPTEDNYPLCDFPKWRRGRNGSKTCDEPCITSAEITKGWCALHLELGPMLLQTRKLKTETSLKEKLQKRKHKVASDFAEQAIKRFKVDASEEIINRSCNHMLQIGNLLPVPAITHVAPSSSLSPP